MTTHIALNRIPAAVHAVTSRIFATGGEANLVGGGVIDLLNHREPKDWDIEVFKLSFADLEDIFFDMKTDIVGKSFGIMKVTVNDIDIDINLPRRDNRTGVGHKGFDVEIDPSMTAKEAARRRDFSINSMALCLRTGHLQDHFGGLGDLCEGRLRATDPELFVEDPLRALRAMQLLARKAEFVDTNTMALIRGMRDEFSDLPKERVWEEFRKLMMKAEKPSVGLQFLQESGWMEHFPELTAMMGCEQNKEWHPEGDVWTHAKMAADAAAQIRHLIPEHQREGFMFGVWLHDIGKPDTTITQKMIDDEHPLVVKRANATKRDPQSLLLTAHGHDVAGVAPAESFMRRLTNSVKTIELVKGIVEHHMQPWNLFSGNAGKGAFARLHRKMKSAGGDLRLIGHVCQCDACATGFERSLASGQPNWEHKTSQRIFEFAEEFDKDNSAVEPKVKGRDLIKRGLKPGPQFGTIIARALEIQDSDASLTKEEILNVILS